MRPRAAVLALSLAVLLAACDPGPRADHAASPAGAISGGSSALLTFRTAGTYDDVCQFHPGSMTGTVVVR